MHSSRKMHKKSQNQRSLHRANTTRGSDGSIKIPTVAVVGDQSHGKSSLMELISGMNLPRANYDEIKSDCDCYKSMAQSILLTS